MFSKLQAFFSGRGEIIIFIALALYLRKLSEKFGESENFCCENPVIVYLNRMVNVRKNKGENKWIMMM